MVSVLSCGLWECGTPLHCHYFQIKFDSEWLDLFGCHRCLISTSGYVCVSVFGRTQIKKKKKKKNHYKKEIKRKEEFNKIKKEREKEVR